jgi:hypothetical protein
MTSHLKRICSKLKTRFGKERLVKKNHEDNMSTSQHCHESEPKNNQPPKKRNDKFISVSESHILYPNIDDHVAVRKPVRSCTKHPISNFIIIFKIFFICLHLSTSCSFYHVRGKRKFCRN